MGQEGIRVDLTELTTAAANFERIAELVQQVSRTDVDFGGGAAGRAHAGAGDAVQRGLQRWVSELAQWSRAAAEIGVSLRAGARRYAETDRGAAAMLG